MSFLCREFGISRKTGYKIFDRYKDHGLEAFILARVFGNSPDFWLNVQRRSDLWEAMHSPRDRERIKRARPLTAAA
jgi:antitoxin HigA-1